MKIEKEEFKHRLKIAGIVLAFFIAIITAVVLINIYVSNGNYKNYDYKKLTIMNSNNELICRVEGNVSIDIDSNQNEIYFIIKTSENTYQDYLVHINNDYMYIIQNKENKHNDKYYYDIIWGGVLAYD